MNLRIGVKHVILLSCHKTLVTKSTLEGKPLSHPAVDLSISEPAAWMLGCVPEENDFAFGPNVLFKDFCAASMEQRSEENDSTIQNGSVE